MARLLLSSVHILLQASVEEVTACAPISLLHIVAKSKRALVSVLPLSDLRRLLQMSLILTTVGFLSPSKYRGIIDGVAILVAYSHLPGVGLRYGPPSDLYGKKRWKVSGKLLRCKSKVA